MQTSPSQPVQQRHNVTVEEIKPIKSKEKN